MVFGVFKRMRSKVRFLRAWEQPDWGKKLEDQNRDLAILRTSVQDGEDTYTCRLALTKLRQFYGDNVVRYLQCLVAFDFLKGAEFSPKVRSAVMFSDYPSTLLTLLRERAKEFTPEMRAAILDMEDSNIWSAADTKTHAETWQHGANLVKWAGAHHWQKLGDVSFPSPGVPCLLRGDDIGKFPADTLICAHLLDTRIPIGLVDVSWTATKLRAGHGVLPLHAQLPALARYLTKAGFEGDAQGALVATLSRIMPRANWSSHVRRVQAIVDCGKYLLDNVADWKQDDPSKTRKQRTKANYEHHGKKTRRAKRGAGSGEHDGEQTREHPGLAGTERMAPLLPLPGGPETGRPS